MSINHSFSPLLGQGSVMASTSQLDLFRENSKATRKSYTREFKLDVVTWYRQNTLYATSKTFLLNTKTILRWATSESKIKERKKGSKYVKHAAKGEQHEVEAALYQEYKELRTKGLKVKGYWFKLRARINLQIFRWVVYCFQEKVQHQPTTPHQYLPESTRGQSASNKKLSQ